MQAGRKPGEAIADVAVDERPERTRPRFRNPLPDEVLLGTELIPEGRPASSCARRSSRASSLDP
jgi:hypothetical protein